MSAWTVIAHTEVGSGGASSIEFMSVGNISSAYTDLVIKYSLRSDQSAYRDAYLQFNSSTADFTGRALEGSGSAASSSTLGRYLGTIGGTNITSSTFINGEAYIPNYAGSTNKSFSVDSVLENNASTAYSTLYAGLWSQSAAITKITLTVSTGNFAQYSSATLYGITKGSSGGVTVS